MRKYTHLLSKGKHVIDATRIWINLRFYLTLFYRALGNGSKDIVSHKSALISLISMDIIITVNT